MSETSPVQRRPAGELEASVLAALWAAGGPLSPAEVQSALGGRLARTTVTTILTRLHDKGAVSRARAGRGFVYSPIQDSAGLTARRMRSELDKQDDRGTALARFVSQLTSEDEQLLRSLLEDAEGAPEGPGTGSRPGPGPGTSLGADPGPGTAPDPGAAP
ncbi:Predicted transcriptional regulator [Streptomyces sp. 2224.1]|uniref:BlaI/MecI/CopY family transcriptional regulator n=1 Tax=unclassified Streptomyces TaxID=2593676 RepID=UPI00088D6EE8|nr:MULTISPECIES: BlaI/MecI/CopY family transcriptional regulator [unclassified Streptomyces]PBC85175.1 putative transcriptional regulator [Streptomyces sp. 2321.6]SDR20739.1 Predicted transcriptional regulator [Streptomyces sp. KS_16]SEB52653.1 Predicted transcriptional regulator [Streptomyces sp. 2224.1]SED58510.1 Predicted transcriptional regulator [Streptomyces sp. 2133.1]SEE25679.1 Predicted transcriptional regulator [Streptomyces sp. 2112.3]